MTQIGEPAPATNSGQMIALESGAAELSQAVRRLDRAVLAFKIEAGMELGKTVVDTPLTRELRKASEQLEGVRRAFSLDEEEK